MKCVKKIAKVAVAVFSNSISELQFQFNLRAAFRSNNTNNTSNNNSNSSNWEANFIQMANADHESQLVAKTCACV